MRSPLLGCIAAALALGVFALTPALAQEACPQPCQSGCCEAGCGCEACCEPQCCLCDLGCPGLIGGAEVTLLKPHFRDNVALTTVNTGTAGVTSETANSFNNHYDASPRIWLGYVGAHGFGGRVSYWVFDHAAGDEAFVQTTTAAAFTGGFQGQSWALTTLGTGTQLSVTSNIRAYTLDFDTMQRLDAGHWKMNLGGGLRHASIMQSYGARVTQGTTVFRALEIRTGGDGIGPTVFAELKRPIGRTGLSFVSNVRGAFLFGNGGFEAIQGAAGFTAAPAATVWTQKQDAATFSMGQIQIGAEWAKELSCGSLVVQGLWEGQYWQGVENAYAAKDDMGLMGFTFQVGLTR